MPHVIVKLYAGRSEQQKAGIAEAVTRAIMESAGSAERSISVSVEDIQPDEWVEQVYRPDIMEKMELVYKKPGYDPL
ncbi:MAG: tautomerase family protein [Mesorhizobium sp.]